MDANRYSRQSFLGPNSQDIIDNTTVGVVGLGGGGSHIVQQLAHIGFKNYVLYDKDIVEETNLNRLVGAKWKDVGEKTPKVKVSIRVISGLHRKKKIVAHQSIWQENPAALKQCDIVFGCVDGFSQRQQLEAFCRRYLIPYIDIGMDVHSPKREGDHPDMAGQVIVSMPGEPCMQCMTFLTPENMQKEAGKYGAAGGNPQVIWPNGALASAAVGFAIDILTGWSGESPRVAWLSYRGNLGTLTPDHRLPYISQTCTHYPLTNVGAPVFKPL